MAAAAGAMADFGRLPTSKKILLFAGIGLVAGFLYYRLVYKSLDASVDTAKAAQKAAGDQNSALDNDAKLFAEFRAKKEEYDYIIRENQKALPTESEVPAFFETLERKITESGVEIIKWNKRPEEPVESFVKVPLEVELSGSFLQVKRFFASLAEKKQNGSSLDKGSEERERIVSIENLALTTPAVRNREIILTAKFTAVTFRQADAVAPAAGGPSTAPSAAPAGGSSPAMPSSAPPMPSAGTPAGAKARTEDALDKDQQRRDGAIEKANGGGSDRLKGGL